MQIATKKVLDEITSDDDLEELVYTIIDACPYDFEFIHTIASFKYLSYFDLITQFNGVRYFYKMYKLIDMLCFYKTLIQRYEELWCTLYQWFYQYFQPQGCFPCPGTFYINPEMLLSAFATICEHLLCRFGSDSNSSLRSYFSINPALSSNPFFHLCSDSTSVRSVVPMHS